MTQTPHNPGPQNPGRQNKDRIVSTIFGQLELLQELALKAEETELANDLSVALAGALFRLCDRKQPDARPVVARNVSG